MNRPPPSGTRFDQLPTSPADRHAIMVDIFGRHLLWTIEAASRSYEILVKSPVARQKLGGAVASPYVNVASKLGPEEQEVAFRLVEAALQLCARNVLFLLESQGIALKLDEKHAVQYRLTAEIRDVENMEVQVEEVINRKGKKAFADYWGHWLREASRKEHGG